jgi:hypothetical protein
MPSSTVPFVGLAQPDLVPTSRRRALLEDAVLRQEGVLTVGNRKVVVPGFVYARSFR